MTRHCSEGVQAGHAECEVPRLPQHVACSCVDARQAAFGERTSRHFPKLSISQLQGSWATETHSYVLGAQ